MPAGFDPTVINGGIINAYGTNARLGAGDWMVVEADESDGTFLKLPADIAIVTNIDAEHLDHFKTFDAVQDAFLDFVENVPFYGFAVMCTDHPIVQRWSAASRTAASSPTARIRRPTCGSTDLEQRRRPSQLHGAVPRPRRRDRCTTINDLTLPMPGRHNALNATSAIAVAHELAFRDDAIRKALAGFGGVKRRFTRAGEWNGVTIIDDYGHHPVEIAAVLQGGARIDQGPGDRGGAAASLYAAAALFEQFSHLLQRRRRGDRRRRLSGRRGADRGRRPRSSGARPCARAAIARSLPLDGPAAARRHRQGHRQAGRLSWSASAPATSRNGPMRCRAS